MFLDESLKLLSMQSELVTVTLEWLREPTALRQRANTALLLANMARTGTQRNDGVEYVECVSFGQSIV